jgi:hypothetical protein
MKKKILTLSDHPQSSSGVGLQSKIFCESLLKTGRYQIISLGGATFGIIIRIQYIIKDFMIRMIRLYLYQK